MTFFAKTLIDWYLQHRRDLPWRQTTDPYHIWLSEIMLQQTRVTQGMPYYFSFIKAFPSIFDLADADEQQVLKLWQGLGYYSRARNLHATAKFVASELGGNFPDTFEDLVKLKGVGDYTAAAIASMSFGQPVPVVDGNVFRVLARYFGMADDIASPRTKKLFTQIAAENLPSDQPATYNQALMEFGALQCVPGNPDCNVCPLQTRCAAFSRGLVNELPVKSKKSAPKNRYLSYLVYEDPGRRTLIKKRTGKGIWQHLYEFPVVESDRPHNPSQVMEQSPEYRSVIFREQLDQYDVVHKLSHQTLHIRFVRIGVERPLEHGIPISQLKEYPFPIVLANFIERYFGRD